MQFKQPSNKKQLTQTSQLSGPHPEDQNISINSPTQQKKSNIFSDFLTFMKLGFGGVDEDTHD